MSTREASQILRSYLERLLASECLVAKTALRALELGDFSARQPSIYGEVLDAFYGDILPVLVVLWHGWESRG